MTRKKLVIGISVATILYILSPYYATYSLYKALKNGDTESLESMIDFPSLRESLKEDLNAMVLQGKSPSQELKDPFALFTTALASKLVDSIVDAYITPSGITNLINNRSIKPAIPEEEPTQLEQNDRIKLSEIKYAFFTNPTTFIVNINDVKVKLKIHDWGWKLTSIKLPDLP